jgi:hypothetical protein
MKHVAQGRKINRLNEPRDQRIDGVWILHVAANDACSAAYFGQGSQQPGRTLRLRPAP